jgi:hypothetical protein
LSYDKYVKESRLFIRLITPSPLSFVISCFFAGLILLAASWTYLRTQHFFNTYLSGDYGFNSVFHQINLSLGKTFDSDLSYNIAVICFAVLVGLGVYAIAESVRHMIAEAHTVLEEVEYADQRNKTIIERSLSIRVGLRALSAFVWLSYTIFFFNGILPYCASFISKGTGDLVVLASIRNFLAFVLLLLATHMHVVFVRLIILRPRVFGGTDAIGRGGH